MRVYALLLGITLTIGYGYAGQVALMSVETANRHASLVERADRAPDPLYFGGTLAPITVEATAATATSGAHTVVTVPLAHSGERCAASGQPRYRAISSEKLRTSIGLEM